MNKKDVNYFSLQDALSFFSDPEMNAIESDTDKLAYLLNHVTSINTKLILLDRIASLVGPGEELIPVINVGKALKLLS